MSFLSACRNADLPDSFFPTRQVMPSMDTQPESSMLLKLVTLARTNSIQPLPRFLVSHR